MGTRVVTANGTRKELWGLESRMFVTSVLRLCVVCGGFRPGRKTLRFEEAKLPAGCRKALKWVGWRGSAALGEGGPGVGVRQGVAGDCMERHFGRREGTVWMYV